MFPIIPIYNTEGKVSHYAYSCESQVIGIGSFPLLGDPSQVMGLNAHPGLISAISVSYDGKYLFSCGGHDLSAFMFEINLNHPNNPMNNNNNNGDMMNTDNMNEQGSVNSQSDDNSTTSKSSYQYSSYHHYHYYL